MIPHWSEGCRSSRSTWKGVSF